jgi:hypothetical protein
MSYKGGYSLHWEDECQGGSANKGDETIDRHYVALGR